MCSWRQWEQRAEGWDHQWLEGWNQRAESSALGSSEQRSGEWEQHSGEWEQPAQGWDQRVEWWEQRAEGWEQRADEWEQNSGEWQQRSGAREQRTEGWERRTERSKQRPEGLVLASIAGEKCLEDALQELEPMFGDTTMFEAGISYKAAESKQRCSVGVALGRIPAICSVIRAAMAALERNLPGDFYDRLNIICRQYGPGDLLGFHRDSIGLFGVEVFGAVMAGSGPGLVFKRGQGRERQEFVLDEVPGLVFASGGPSRYFWSHGVPARPAGSAKRVSITWRWVRQSALLWMHINQTARDEWVQRFIVAARKARIPESQIAAFLWESSRWYETKNDRMGPLLSGEDTASAMGIADAKALPVPETWAREPAQLRAALSLLDLWQDEGSPFGVSLASSRQTQHSARDQGGNSADIRRKQSGGCPWDDSGDSKKAEALVAVMHAAGKDVPESLRQQVATEAPSESVDVEAGPSKPAASPVVQAAKLATRPTGVAHAQVPYSTAGVRDLHWNRTNRSPVVSSLCTQYRGEFGIVDYDKPWFEQKRGEWYCNLCNAYATEGHIRSDKHVWRTETPHWYGYGDELAAEPPAWLNEPWFEQKEDGQWYCNLCRAWATDGHVGSDKHSKRAAAPWDYGYDACAPSGPLADSAASAASATSAASPAPVAPAASGPAVPSASSAPSTAFPSEWEKVHSEEHDCDYYFNMVSGQTQWEAPAADAVITDALVAAPASIVPDQCHDCTHSYKFPVYLENYDGVPLGINVKNARDGKALEITCVKEDGLAQGWNSRCQSAGNPQDRLLQGDLIIIANGVRGCAEDMVESMRSSNDVQLLVLRDTGVQ